MKLIALAAALAVGGTAIAQDMPAQTGGTAQTAEPTTSTTTDTTTDGSTMITTGAGTPSPAPATTPDSQGGYASTPVITGTPQPGSPVYTAPSPTPSEAFPAPAPLDS